MSDLAPFVAAALRDKVVGELHQEVVELRQLLTNQQTMSQLVSITGPMGTPVYTQASYQHHGKFDVSPELWKVEFHHDSSNSSDNDNAKDGNDGRSMACIGEETETQAEEGDHTTTTSGAVAPSLSEIMQQQHHDCTLAQLSEMEIRIGGILKAKLMNGRDDSAIEGFVNDIDNNYSSGKGALSIWFGGSSGIWLTIRLQIPKEAYRALQNMDLSGRHLTACLQQYCGPNAMIEFTEVSFLISHMNHAMEAWGMPTEPPEDAEEEDVFMLASF